MLFGGPLLTKEQQEELNAFMAYCDRMQCEIDEWTQIIGSAVCDGYGNYLFPVKKHWAKENWTVEQIREWVQVQDNDNEE